MGKEVERLWEDLEEEKNIIKTYCMAIVKTIFKSNKSFKIYIRTGKLIVSLFKLNHVIKQIPGSEVYGLQCLFHFVYI